MQILINTFFDTSGEPIVYNPKILLNVLWGLILEALVINNFVLKKEKIFRIFFRGNKYIGKVSV